MAKVIGKADKFYTLWEITTDTYPMADGRHYTVTHHIYIKNLSFNKETAMAKVPEAEVDESLRGHHSFETVKYPEPPVDTFHAGKYRGQKVVDCTDTDYLGWAWNNYRTMFSKEMEPIVETKLVEAGWRHTWSDEYYSDPTEVAEYNARAERLEELREMARTNTEFDFLVECNLSEEGECGVLNGDVLLKFKNYATYYYRGWPYGLPVDGNGKAKRIKNKELHIKAANVEIAEKDWSPVVTITVESFEIKKEPKN